MLKPLIYRLARYSNRGSILIIVLWSLCLLATMAVYMGVGIRQRLVLVDRIDDRDKLHFIGEAGVKKAVLSLSGETQKAYHVLKDSWSNNISAFRGIQIGDGQFSLYYNYIDEVTGQEEIRYGLIDEQRKININHADQHVLKRLFEIVLCGDKMTAQELAASVVDWRDSDSELSIPLGSAEDSYYRSLREGYEAKDEQFQVLDEILLVKGMENDIYQRVKDYITIYGNGYINVNTVSKEVLRALGLNERIADKILSYRRGEDELIATKDDNVFESAASIIPKLSQYTSLSDSEIGHLSAIVEKYLTTSSESFMARSVAQLDNDTNTSEIIAVFNTYGEVLYWKEY